ncbi:MAG: DNA mismatch repair endonuclease MutL [Myxococcota bacterium]
MEDEIKLLPEHIINQIAAGEVIERPASVIKELVENSLDAGAQKIEVEIEKGGTEKIIVSDDGRGMDKNQLRQAIVRHATSKIHSMEDLEKISTFGFRGEAVPSIASISHMKISSRKKGSELGNLMIIDGGVVKKSEPFVQSTGTRIEINRLFHNVPARLKFLKSIPVETSHIQDTILQFSLANPEVHFVFKKDGRLIFDLPGHGSYLERAKVALKRRAKGALRSTLTKYETEFSPDLKVRVLLAPPEITLRDSSGLYFFVNHRAIKNKTMLKAVLGGYGALVDRGRYPIALVFTRINPTQVDVNVHPRKAEVKFQNDRLIAGTIRRTVVEGIAQANWHRDNSGYASSGQSSKGEKAEEKARHQQNVMDAIRSSRAGAARSQNSIAGSRSQTRGKSGARGQARSGKQRDFSSTSGQGGNSACASRSDQAKVSRKYKLITPEKTSDSASTSKSRSGQTSLNMGRKERYLGVHAGLFLIFSKAKELLFIDMHAAHERIVYSRIISRLKSEGVNSQRLLYPESIELDPEKIELIEEKLEILKNMGLLIEVFGSNTLLVRGYPAILRNPDLKEMIFAIAAELESGGSGEDLGGLTNSLAATMACHSAIRSGDKITREEAFLLLDQIRETKTGGYCPHGRPVIFTMSNSQIRKKFKRT